VTKVRTLKSGATVGGIPFTRGPLAHLLRNRFYIGEVMFKGEVLAGEQPAIVDRGLFDAVQVKLSEQANNHKTTRMKSEALLTGRIFDDRGNHMTPSHVRKRGIKYRYYLSTRFSAYTAEKTGVSRPLLLQQRRENDMAATTVGAISRHMQCSKRGAWVCNGLLDHLVGPGGQAGRHFSSSPSASAVLMTSSY
jgi:Recombinase